MHVKLVVVHSDTSRVKEFFIILIFRLKKERIKIHEQLAVSIILVQLVYLLGIDRTENQVRYTNYCRCMADCSLGISHCVLVHLARFDSNLLCSINVWVHGNTKNISSSLSSVEQMPVFLLYFQLIYLFVLHHTFTIFLPDFVQYSILFLSICNDL